MTNLRVIRESLRVSQERVSRLTNLSFNTYCRAEYGQPVRHSTAMQILDAINSILVERGKEPVTLDDLGLNLD